MKSSTPRFQSSHCTLYCTVRSIAPCIAMSAIEVYVHCAAIGYEQVRKTPHTDACRQPVQLGVDLCVCLCIYKFEMRTPNMHKKRMVVLYSATCADSPTSLPFPGGINILRCALTFLEQAHGSFESETRALSTEVRSRYVVHQVRSCTVAFLAAVDRNNSSYALLDWSVYTRGWNSCHCI